LRSFDGPAEKKRFKHLRIKISTKRTHISDRLLAAPTFRKEQIHVVLLTVGQAVLLVEVALLEWYATVGTLETVWMPHFVERIDRFLQKSCN